MGLKKKKEYWLKPFRHREMEHLRKNKKEMLEVKDTVREVKVAFDGLISGLDMAEKTINEPEGR